MASEGKKIRIRIKDMEETRCCPALKKLVGRVFIATVLTSGLYSFDFNASSGLSGPVRETHQIPPHFAAPL